MWAIFLFFWIWAGLVFLIGWYYLADKFRLLIFVLLLGIWTLVLLYCKQAYF